MQKEYGIIIGKFNNPNTLMMLNIFKILMVIILFLLYNNLIVDSAFFILSLSVMKEILRKVSKKGIVDELF